MNQATPALSVIMTVYNAEKYVAETVEAVLAQSFADFEYVIVNNGCTDATMDIIARYEDPRIRIIKAAAHGSFTDGIRLAYQNARAEILAVQDGDDVSFPDRFEKQMAAFDADPDVAIVVGAYREIDENGAVLSEVHPISDEVEIRNAVMFTNPFAHSTFAYRKSAAEKVGGYPAQYNYGSDFAMMVRLLKGGAKVKVLDDLLLKLRTHPEQVTARKEFSALRAHDALHIYLETTDMPGASAKAVAANRKIITRCYIRYALETIRNGDIRKGVSGLLTGLARQPFYGAAYTGYRLVRGL